MSDLSKIHLCSRFIIPVLELGQPFTPKIIESNKDRAAHSLAKLFRPRMEWTKERDFQTGGMAFTTEVYIFTPDELKVLAREILQGNYRELTR